jgi:hypothetical protein
MRLGTGAAVALVLALPPSIGVGADAFPGAAGFGKGTQGGRAPGARVFVIRNTQDAGAGSLRECVEASGPRYCVFSTGGTVSLLAPLRMRSSQLTIYGQTAPGGGVQVRLDPASRTNGQAFLAKDVGQLVIRHMRLRPGLPPGLSNPASVDALTLENVEDAIIDRTSMQWAADEDLNIHLSGRRITVQYSIMAEGLLPHSKGSLGCSQALACQEITFWRNLYYSNRDRNPDWNGVPSGQIDFINNVIYNPQSAFGEIWASYGGTHINFVGNTCWKGPNTWSQAVCVRAQTAGATGPQRIYDAAGTANANEADVPLRLAGTDRFFEAAPVGPYSVAPVPPGTARSTMWGQLGATRPKRDTVDNRIVSASRNRTGGAMITDPAQVGGWPDLAAGTSRPDRDRDGLPDAWETQQGLDPNDPSDALLDADGDGYPNLEEWANGLGG